MKKIVVNTFSPMSTSTFVQSHFNRIATALFWRVLIPLCVMCEEREKAKEEICEEQQLIHTPRKEKII